MPPGVTADKPPPQVAGPPITFTASATGGTPPYQFKWWVYDGTMWMVAQDWSASPTFAWTPSAANAAAQLSTCVRSSANLTDTYESFKLTSFAITPLTPSTVNTATPQTPSNHPPRTPLAFTTTAT